MELQTVYTVLNVLPLLQQNSDATILDMKGIAVSRGSACQSAA
jgi:cysteine sulfinate desulfinase/cysteine desulfurase-like protein